MTHQNACSLPLDHQQTAQIRVVKGFGCAQYGPLPSSLPSRARAFCRRGRWGNLQGDDSGNRIVNHLEGYRKQEILVTPMPMVHS